MRALATFPERYEVFLWSFDSFSKTFKDFGYLLVPLSWKYKTICYFINRLSFLYHKYTSNSVAH